MPPPSPLAIATSSLQRLVKEEASYYKELEKQEARLKKIEESTEEDENREYTLKQEVSLPPPRIYPSCPSFPLPFSKLNVEWIHVTVEQDINDVIIESSYRRDQGCLPNAPTAHWG